MNNRSFSEEEMRQREKEERSRLRKQEQAYREAQRGVYSRIYQEQDAMPEDYRAAFWEDPRDRLYDQDRQAAQKGDEWAAERRQIQEELWDDPWPKSRGDRRTEPPGDPPRRPRPPRTGTLPMTSGSPSRNCGRGDRRPPSESESHPPLPEEPAAAADLPPEGPAVRPPEKGGGGRFW